MPVVKLTKAQSKILQKFKKGKELSKQEQKLIGKFFNEKKGTFDNN